MFFIGLATEAYKEYINILPLAAPYRFSCEQALYDYVTLPKRLKVLSTLEIEPDHIEPNFEFYPSK